MNLTIELTEAEMQSLAQKAQRSNTTAEKLVEKLVRRLTEAEGSMDVEAAIDHVLQKNAELYERLA